MNPPPFPPQKIWHQNTRYIAMYINVQQNSSPSISYCLAHNVAPEFSLRKPTELHV